MVGCYDQGSEGMKERPDGAGDSGGLQDPNEATCQAAAAEFSTVSVLAYNPATAFPPCAVPPSSGCPVAARHRGLLFQQPSQLPDVRLPGRASVSSAGFAGVGAGASPSASRLRSVSSLGC